MEWKKIKGYKNYKINKLGEILNVKTNKKLNGWTNSSGVVYVCLSKNNKPKLFQVAKLVIDHFKPSRTVINTQAIHTDLNLENCSNVNLERGTLGDRLRMFNEIRQKRRGVYPFPHGKKKWRATFKDRNGRYKTVGYFKTKWYAEFAYAKAYKLEFGRSPY